MPTVRRRGKSYTLNVSLAGSSLHRSRCGLDVQWCTTKNSRALRRPVMPMQSITLPGRRSRAEELYDHLRAAILSGELRPSERLVENTLAELASVSRTPVRQALQQLESDGLLRESKSGGMEV